MIFSLFHRSSPTSAQYKWICIVTTYYSNQLHHCQRTTLGALCKVSCTCVAELDLFLLVECKIVDFKLFAKKLEKTVEVVVFLLVCKNPPWWWWWLSSAESARAVTGRRCPHSGEGEDFLTGQLNFFTKTAVTPERKLKNQTQGGKWTVMPRAKNGSLTKLGSYGKNRIFEPKTEI